jgi:3',5'-cyclic AMP phosphodiesterase CpdA
VARERLTFAVLPDRTAGARPGVFESAVERLNTLDPELVVSIGDLVEGDAPTAAEAERRWDEVEAMLRSLRAPLYAVPGNHDLSNPLMRAAWRRRRGAEYHHLAAGDCLFLFVNTDDPPPSRSAESQRWRRRLQALHLSDPDAAAAEAAREMRGFDWEGPQPAFIGEAQLAYFEDLLAKSPRPRWTFVFMHRPAWQAGGNPEVARLVRALGQRPYTVFSGHLHNYRRFQLHGREHIRLGAAGGGFGHPQQEGNIDHVVRVVVERGRADIESLPLALAPAC